MVAITPPPTMSQPMTCGQINSTPLLSAMIRTPAHRIIAVRRQYTGLFSSKTAFHKDITKQAKKTAAARPMLSNSTGSHGCVSSIISIQFVVHHPPMRAACFIAAIGLKLYGGNVLEARKRDENTVTYYCAHGT